MWAAATAKLQEHDQKITLHRRHSLRSAIRTGIAEIAACGLDEHGDIADPVQAGPIMTAKKPGL